MKRIISFVLLATSLAQPIQDVELKDTKTFVCESSPDPVTEIREEALSPDSELATRSFLLSRDKRWPRGIVPYELDPSFSITQTNLIIEAMQMFSNSSCLKWVRRYMQQDYVKFIHVPQKDKCNSAVGRKGGMQTLNLGDDCFDVENGYQGAIAHEMMHAIGFIHEQQRIDRDCFVQVAEKVAVSRKFDYGITLHTETSFPYDFGSIMHYGSSNYMKSNNGERLGNFEGMLTDLDKMKLNNMYCGGQTYCEVYPNNCLKFLQAQDKCLVKGT